MSVWQTRAKVAFLFLIQGLYIRDFMDPTACRRASPSRTLPNTFAASLLAKYADRSPLLFQRPTASATISSLPFGGFGLACFALLFPLIPKRRRSSFTLQTNPNENNIASKKKKEKSENNMSHIIF